MTRLVHTPVVVTNVTVHILLQTAVAVPAPGNGIIEEIFVQDGSTVKAGQKLFRIKLTGKFSSKKELINTPSLINLKQITMLLVTAVF